jgi:hypothetical protein
VAVLAAYRRLERASAAATPDGVAASIANLAASGRDMASDIRKRATQREAELRSTLLATHDDDAERVATWRAGRATGRRAHRADGHPTQAGQGASAAASRPGGLQPGDQAEPLYDF